MKILEPQSAILSNVEVLAHLTQNPPRPPPEAPPNAPVNYVPVPDLRDLNTVVREFHNYASRISPHLYDYPSFTANELASMKTSGPTTTSTSASTPLDTAIRTLITDLRPYGLTKAEVLLILNLGVGIRVSASASAPNAPQNAQDEGDIEMVGESNPDANADGGADAVGDGNEATEGGGGEAGEEDDGDYGALALLDTVIEGREERLSDEDLGEILRIIRQTLQGGVVG